MQEDMLAAVSIYETVVARCWHAACNMSSSTTINESVPRQHPLFGTQMVLASLASIPAHECQGNMTLHSLRACTPC